MLSCKRAVLGALALVGYGRAIRLFALAAGSSMPSGGRHVGEKNVLGTQLELCCSAPKTGFYRDGYCCTGPQDLGAHVVCAEVTEGFLRYTKGKGNDVSFCFKFDTIIYDDDLTTHKQTPSSNNVHFVPLRLVDDAGAAVQLPRSQGWGQVVPLRSSVGRG